MDQPYTSLVDVLAPYAILVVPLCFLLAIYFRHRAKQFDEGIAAAHDFVEKIAFYLDEDTLVSTRHHYLSMGKIAEFEALLKRAVEVRGRAGLQYGHLVWFDHYIVKSKYAEDQMQTVEVPDFYSESDSSTS